MYKSNTAERILAIASSIAYGGDKIPYMTDAAIRGYFICEYVEGHHSDIKLCEFILSEKPFRSHNNEIAWYILVDTFEEYCDFYGLYALQRLFAKYVNSGCKGKSLYDEFMQNDGDWYILKPLGYLNTDYLNCFPL